MWPSAFNLRHDSDLRHILGVVLPDDYSLASGIVGHEATPIVRHDQIEELATINGAETIIGLYTEFHADDADTFVKEYVNELKKLPLLRAVSLCTSDFSLSTMLDELPDLERLRLCHGETKPSFGRYPNLRELSARNFELDLVENLSLPRLNVLEIGVSEESIEQSIRIFNEAGFNQLAHLTLCHDPGTYRDLTDPDKHESTRPAVQIFLERVEVPTSIYSFATNSVDENRLLSSLNTCLCYPHKQHITHLGILGRDYHHDHYVVDNIQALATQTALAFPNLRYLRLEDSDIPFAALQPLLNHPSLSTLDFSGAGEIGDVDTLRTRLTDAGVNGTVQVLLESSNFMLSE